MRLVTELRDPVRRWDMPYLLVRESYMSGCCLVDGTAQHSTGDLLFVFVT